MKNLFIFLIIVLFLNIAWSDMIVLKNGHKLENVKIGKKTPNFVNYENRYNKKFRIKTNKIKKIIYKEISGKDKTLLIEQIKYETGKLYASEWINLNENIEHLNSTFYRNAAKIKIRKITTDSSSYIIDFLLFKMMPEHIAPIFGIDYQIPIGDLIIEIDNNNYYAPLLKDYITDDGNYILYKIHKDIMEKIDLENRISIFLRTYRGHIRFELNKSNIDKIKYFYRQVPTGEIKVKE